MRLYIRNNPYVDQTVLNDVFLDTNYYKKSIMSTMGVDFTNPTTGTTSYYSGMEAKGEYMAMMKFGYCRSNYD